MEYRSVEDWSLEQARAENARVPDSERFMPNAPIFRWGAMRRLDQLEQEFQDQSSGFAVLAAIRVCANHDVVLPAWLASAFIARYGLVLSCRVDSWDEAFGRPYPKGAHLSRLRKHRVNRPAVYLAVKEAKESNPDTPIDKGMFASIGKPLGLGATLTESLYYEGKAIFNRPL